MWPLQDTCTERKLKKKNILCFKNIYIFDFCWHNIITIGAKWVSQTSLSLWHRRFIDSEGSLTSTCDRRVIDSEGSLTSTCHRRVIDSEGSLSFTARFHVRKHKTSTSIGIIKIIKYVKIKTKRAKTARALAHRRIRHSLSKTHKSSFKHLSSITQCIQHWIPLLISRSFSYLQAVRNTTQRLQKYKTLHSLIAHLTSTNTGSGETISSKWQSFIERDQSSV